MSLHRTLVTTARVLRQLRHDRRTIALVVVLPCLLLSIVAWMFSGTPTLDHWGPMLVGMFPMLVMFLVTSVAMLRERQSGTLERLMTLPVGRADVVVGYALAFALLATVQGLVLVGFTTWVLGMDVAGRSGSSCSWRCSTRCSARRWASGRRRSRARSSRRCSSCPR